MMHNLLLLLITFFCIQTVLHAEDNYCYQKPDVCSAGDTLILSLADDVAKYCDFNKQVVSIERNTRSSSSFHKQDVVCVKIAVPRKKLK